MKIQNEVIEGRFIKRLNRFEALIDIDGRETLVHVPNTGRCKELLIEGVRVLLEIRKSPTRKTPYELIIVFKDDRPVSIDSQLPNKIAEEALKAGAVKEVKGYTYIKREQVYGDSRFDLYLRNENEECFVEVKGVTLEKDGIAMFPDAPTERGAKHVRELIRARSEGYRAVLFFLIQLDFTSSFTPNKDTDPDFAAALRDAALAGVEIIAYDCKVEKNEVRLNKPIPVRLLP